MSSLRRFWDTKSQSSRLSLIVGGLVGLILLISVGVVASLSYSDSNISVKNVTVTNVTDTAFTLTWVSDTPYIGRVVYQKSSENWPALFAQAGKQLAYDDRDVEISTDGNYVQVEAGAQPRYTHHVTVRNLQPETEYSFRVAGAMNGKQAEIATSKTLSIIEDITTPDPAYGKVEGGEGKDTILVFTYNDETSQKVVSTFTSAASTYSFDANGLGQKDFSAALLTANVSSGKDKGAIVTFKSGAYKPLDTIVLGPRQNSVAVSSNSSLVKGISAATFKNTNDITACSAENSTPQEDGSGAYWVIRTGASADSTTRIVYYPGKKFSEVKDYVSTNGSLPSGWVDLITCKGKADGYYYNTKNGTNICYNGATYRLSCSPGAKPVLDKGTYSDDTTTVAATIPQEQTTSAYINTAAAGRTDADGVSCNGFDATGNPAAITPIHSGITGKSIKKSELTNYGNLNYDAANPLGNTQRDNTFYCACPTSDPETFLVSASRSRSYYPEGTQIFRAADLCGFNLYATANEVKPKVLNGYQLADLNTFPYLKKNTTTVGIESSSTALVVSKDYSLISPVGQTPTWGVYVGTDATGDGNLEAYTTKTGEHAKAEPSTYSVPDLVARKAGFYAMYDPTNCLENKCPVYYFEYCQQQDKAVLNKGTVADPKLECVDRVQVAGQNVALDTIKFNGVNIQRCPLNNDLALDIPVTFSAKGVSAPVPNVQRLTGAKYTCFDPDPNATNADFDSNYDYSVYDQCKTGYVFDDGSDAALPDYVCLKPVPVVDKTVAMYYQTWTDVDPFNKVNTVTELGACNTVKKTDFKVADYPNAADVVSGTKKYVVSKADGKIYYANSLGNCDPTVLPGNIQGIANLTNKVAAESARASAAILGTEDTQAPAVSEPGRYSLFQDGAKVAEFELVTNNEKTYIAAFNDTNANGVKDTGESYIQDYSSFSVAKDATAQSYTLDAGWNLIHIPLVDNRTEGAIKKASQLLQHWKDAGASILHVARFKNGKFDIYTLREDDNTFAGDFNILPGDGLFVYSANPNAEVIFSGNAIESALSLNLSQGWNLVGIVSPGKNYDSEQVLDAMSSQGITADTFSQFDGGKYQSIVKESGTTFGNNFNVVSTKGYFVKVNGGGGKTFKP
jgi:hypothetical protein